MDVKMGLPQWLARHPVRRPPEALQRGYTQDVMRRITLMEHPAPSVRWFTLPRLMLGLGTAVAVVAVAVVLIPRSPTELAQRPERMPPLVTGPLTPEELARNVSQETVQPAEPVILAKAQSPSDDQAWIDQTLDLLDRLDSEEPIAAPHEPPSDETWLDELRWLDEAELELAATS